MAKGQFEKGNSGKPKGAKNKATILGRDIIEEHFIAKGGLAALLRDIAAMESERDRVTAQIKLLEFFIPKQRETTVEQTNSQPNFDLSKLTDAELRKYIELSTKCAPDTSGDSEA
jgi:hypothetical protein